MLISELVKAAWQVLPNGHAVQGLLGGLLGPAEQEGMAGYQFYREMREAIRLAPEAKSAADLLRMVEEAMPSIDETKAKDRLE